MLLPLFCHTIGSASPIYPLRRPAESFSAIHPHVLEILGSEHGLGVWGGCPSGVVAEKKGCVRDGAGAAD